MTIECWVYENWTNKRARMHLPSCSYCNSGTGIHSEDSGRNGVWRLFSSLEAGKRFLASVEYEDVKFCDSCLGYLEEGDAFSRLYKNQAFTICHADSVPFEGAGLRPFFEYRQLGIREATQGAYGAHVIRAVPGMRSPAEWHSHDLGFQMVYVTKGWVEFEYEGEGAHILREGSCVLQPPGIRHRLVKNSDDMELVEITSPAEFVTQPEGTPDEVKTK